MAPRSLFDVILKVLGIFFIRDFLEAFSRALSVLVYFPQYATDKVAFFNLGVTIPPLVLYGLFTWLLIFRTQGLINLLRIEKTFGIEPLNIKFNKQIALTIAVVLAGGWMLVSEIPEFFRHAVYYYQERILYDRMVRADFTYPAMSLAKIVIGLALVIWNTPFVHLIETISKSRLPWKNGKGQTANGKGKTG
jgi:hypothetical protein